MAYTYVLPTHANIASYDHDDITTRLHFPYCLYYYYFNTAPYFYLAYFFITGNATF